MIVLFVLIQEHVGDETSNLLCGFLGFWLLLSVLLAVAATQRLKVHLNFCSVTSKLNKILSQKMTRLYC